MISKAMEPFLAGSSQIRAMFEEGKKMAKIYGEENVYDFSIGRSIMSSILFSYMVIRQTRAMSRPERP